MMHNNRTIMKNTQLTSIWRSATLTGHREILARHVDPCEYYIWNHWMFLIQNCLMG